MTKFPKETYSIIFQIFSTLGFNQEEQNTRVTAFEKEAFNRFLTAIVTKLPEQERATVVNLANNASTDEEKKQLKQKLASWLNEDETLRLFTKITDELTKEMLQNLYKDATEEQKTKLEEKFKKEALE